MSLEKWQLKSSVVVHQTPWIRVVADTCVAKGQELTYTYVKRLDEGSTIIAETTDKKLWLVQQYRHPIKKIIWQFPSEGGKMGENWAEVAQRGLREELHLEAQTLTPLALVHPDPGGIDQRDHYFLAQNLQSVPPPTKHDHEDEVEELQRQAFSWSEIETLIQKGEICDNWTFAGLFLYQRHLLT